MAQNMFPLHLSDYFRAWGPQLRESVRAAQGKVLRRHSLAAPYYSASQRVGSDCCGLSAEVFAFRALGIPHTLAFASDRCRAAKAWTLANASPQHWADDVMKRPMEALKNVQLTSYFAGFPCQPFSLLNSKAKRWRDLRAGIFRTCLSTIDHTQPAYSVMENVCGLLKDWPKVEREFSTRLPGYVTFCLQLCPQQLGKGVRRPRLWLVSVQRARLISHDWGVLQKLIVASMRSASRKTVQHTVSRFLLPSGHPLHLGGQGQKAKAVATRKRGRLTVAKWPLKHAEERKRLLKQKGRLAASRWCGMMTQREREVLQCAETRHGHYQCLSVDVSQSVGRNASHDNVCPTLTTSSRIVCVRNQRCHALSAGEKMLLHSFPLHKAVIPKTIPSQSYHRLVGNSQDVMSCSLAILVATSMVRQSPARDQSSLSHVKGIPVFKLQNGKVIRWFWGKKPRGRSVRPKTTGSRHRRVAGKR